MKIKECWFQMRVSAEEKKLIRAAAEKFHTETGGPLFMTEVILHMIRNYMEPKA